MGPQTILTLAGAAAGAFAAGSISVVAGLPVLASVSAAFLGGISGASCLAALTAGRERRTAEARFDTLAEEMVLLRQRQAEFETKLNGVEQRTVDSPALVWRAATADIQVLGGLVSDLARTVEAHDRALGGPGAQAEPQPAPKPSMVLPETSPPPASWFEDEAELGFTADASPAAAPVAAPQSLPAAVMAELRSTLAAALTSDRLELCLQPFVALPQRKVVGYEATLRLKGESNELQSAEELRTAAGLAGMARDLDRLLIERTGQVLRVLRSRERIVSITCPVAGDSLLDGAFRSAVEAVALNEGKFAQNIIVSLPLADLPLVTAPDAGVDALGALKRMGVSLGARTERAKGIDAAALAKAGVGELRIPAVALSGAAAGDIHPADIGEMLERRGLRLLVTGVDSEATVRDLLDLSAALAQGELFGASRPVRPEVLQPRAVDKGAPSAQERVARAAAAPEPKRQTYRSMLRRA